eukprot:4751801-Amphidinium_carterae.2
MLHGVIPADCRGGLSTVRTWGHCAPWCVKVAKKTPTSATLPRLASLKVLTTDQLATSWRAECCLGPEFSIKPESYSKRANHAINNAVKRRSHVSYLVFDRQRLSSQGRPHPSIPSCVPKLVNTIQAASSTQK